MQVLSLTSWVTVIFILLYPEVYLSLHEVIWLAGDKCHVIVSWKLFYWHVGTLIDLTLRSSAQQKICLVNQYSHLRLFRNLCLSFLVRIFISTRIHEKRVHAIYEFPFKLEDLVLFHLNDFLRIKLFYSFFAGPLEMHMYCVQFRIGVPNPTREWGGDANFFS